VIERREHEWGIELAGFGRPFGLGEDAAGRLHVTDMDRHTLIRFDTALGEPEEIVGPGVFDGPHSVEFAADGRLFVTCYYGPAIFVVDQGGALKLPTTLTGPASAFLDSAGHLLVSEYSQNAVLALDTGGRLAFRFDGTFDRPHMARSLDGGDVIVADTWRNRLQRFDAGGALVADHVATVSCPVAIDPDAERGWLVTAWGDNCVLRFDPSGRCTGRLQSPPLNKPYDARWLSGDRVAVADSHHARVLVLHSPRFH
jgi:sugar lactone lactonase YvrE